jgi:hypothetical protein
MFRSALIAAASIVSCTAFAQDAVQTDGDKYRVMLENDCVRVLDYHDLPGEQTHQHTHPAFVLYTLSAFKRQITLPDGKVLQRQFKEGDVMWSDQQTHIGTNVGETPTHVVIVELKSTTGPCTRK